MTTTKGKHRKAWRLPDQDLPGRMEAYANAFYAVVRCAGALLQFIGDVIQLLHHH